MSIEALIVVLTLLSACAGITVTFVMRAQADTARAVEHIEELKALACSHVDERVRFVW